MLLLPPQLRSAPTVPLDASQSRVADAVASGQSVVVTGAPGSGKTTTAVEIAVQALQGRADPGGILVIAATRRAASQLRDIISSRAGRTISAPPVRTIDSVAFSILRDQALALGQPPPRLINGPEQDHILAEILAAVTEGVGAPLCLPPELDPRALTTRGFRNELRDLFMRAAEHGVTPAQLEALSVQHHKPLWQVAAKLYSQYRAVLSLSSGGLDAGTRLDPAELVAVAARALRNWGPGAKPHFDLVIVDDYQEATAATAQLLTELHKDGAQLVLFGDPDVSVQAFRGAIPGLIGQAAQPSGASIGAFGLPEHVLEHVWRQPEELWAVTSRIAAKIPVLPGSPLRRKAATPDPEHLHAEPSACAITFGGKPQEAAWIAQQLRTEFLLNGTPWGQMAVIARSGAELSDLRRELILAGVPVALLGSDLPLQEEPAVAPLLQLLTLAVGHEPVTAEAVTGLLSSTLAGLDSIAQRRLRRSLRARELAEGGGRSSDELLVALVESVLVAEARGGAEAAWKQHWLSDQHVLGAAIEDGMARILKAIAAGKEAAAQPEQDVTTVLWAVWEAVALAEAWRATALVGGAAGAYADRNLDAVMAFFRRAEFFAERNPGAGVERFIADMMSQQFAADSVAAQGQDRGAVAALTPAGAAGRQWEVVVVAGVQEGTWPDLRLRDTVLGAGELADVMSGRLAAGESGIERGLAARAEVLADETRAFLVAVSRAYRRLIVTAVANQELNPSQFLHLVAEPVAYQPPASDLDVPFDLRGLVTAARIAVLSEGATATLAAELLAELWAAGVPGSDPDEWYGANSISTETPLWGAGESLRISPSSVEKIEKCPLKWAFEAAGVDKGSLNQGVGTLIHEIAAALPSGSYSMLRAELERRWPQLSLKPGWLELQQRSKAEAMLRRLANYYSDLPNSTTAYSEVEFRLETESAVVAGRVDRIECLADGKYRIVDFKTGSTVPSPADAENNEQLRIYQLALNSAAFPALPNHAQSEGGQLLYLGKGTKDELPSVRVSSTLTPQRTEETQKLLVETANVMAAAEFAAKSNTLCLSCTLKFACPLQAAGKQVIS